ncbi:MAG: glycine oxidase ThiO [Acidobacteria bacterium RIFCSPLOWO2_12_FULL_60_22]|nr:MAG: glycine oxidase ThiO [Acidobacteria bacterium RIFCSPLOWO2_12_FULL_60_22]
MRSFDTVIIGGGIIGCALARMLAGSGLQVAVVERGAPGEEASWAAAGMLSPSAEAEKGNPAFELCRASLQLYRQLAAELQSETGMDCQYRAEGTLVLFEDEQDRQTWRPSMEWQRSLGIPIQELSTSELREREPQLAVFPGAFYLSEDHQVDNRLLMRALVQSCRQRGVEFLLGKTVLEVERNGRRASGVLLENDRIQSGQVVNAAGAWAGAVRVPGLAPAPIRPVKGHMLALESFPSLLRHVVRSHRVYLVPRSGGRVLVGSTMEEVGFDKTPRAGPVMRLLRAAQEVCPALEESAVAEFWAGLRPASPDKLPLLGPTSLEGYFVALGHFRNGILLAPVTAQILSGWLLTGKPPALADALLPQRFEQ